MKSVALHNLGCKVNGYETAVMQQMLQQKGYKVVPFDEQADIYIINTCTVTNIADRKSRQMLHRAKKRNPQAVVVAVGCYVQTGGDGIAEDGSIDLAIGNDRKQDLIPILEQYLEQREGKPVSGQPPAPAGDGSAGSLYGETGSGPTDGHTRAFVKIQDGCNQFCSYCIIPYARGRALSRPPREILAEVEALAESGYREIVLTGIHISSYGSDLSTQERSSLIELIRLLHRVDGIVRIRLGSLEPRIITEEFVERMAGFDKICPHFHLSLQSGCDETLRRMNRHYTTREYYEKAELLRRTFDCPAITTDVITGFPGETDEEFAQTKEFLEKMRFYELHVFKYSRRKGTAADRMEGQVPDPVKTERSGELLAMGEMDSVKFREQYIGRNAEVLFEETVHLRGERYEIGHTREYIRTAVRTQEDWSNRIVQGVPISFLQKDLLLLDLGGAVDVENFPDCKKI